MYSFIRRFERLRWNLDLSNSEIAKKAGISKSNLSQIKHSNNPKYNTLIKLAKAMDIKPSEFF